MEPESKAREFRVIGPPGCGKTHYITRQCAHAAERYGGQSVVVCSLTRAAASVAAGAMHSILPPENIGTLHAMAYRAVGQGQKVAEASPDAWNECMKEQGNHHYQLTGGETDADDLRGTAVTTQGDVLLAEMGRLRARMIERRAWPTRVTMFADLWDRYKADANLMDFTDMLEIALRDADAAPGSPAAMLVDESQDLSRLAWSLARKWGEKCLTFITVGDPDQLLYHWAGVDVDAFSAVELPDEQRRVLKQSYRVPRAVHAVATEWIAQTPGRTPVEYLPTEVEGEIRRCAATIRYPDQAIEEAAGHVARGKSVLFAVTCSYQLQSIIRSLREAGIPFHNPYRLKRGDWNPLRPSRGTNAAQRVLALARGSLLNHSGAPWWSVRDLHAVVDWLQASRVLNRGAKTLVEEWYSINPDREISGNELDEVFQPEAFDAFIARDLRFMADAAMEKHRSKLQFPIKVAERFGTTALEEEPKVIVSTIHGCKGGEADVVYLFPDLSRIAAEDWFDNRSGLEGREGIRRAFYVGISRARETLVLCSASSPLAVDFNSRN